MNKETKENNVIKNVDKTYVWSCIVPAHGITLIALIITIIVLLILAGVSINLVIGENGILKQAKDATTIYAQKEQEEKNALDNLYEEYLGHVNSITVEKAPANEINNWDYTLDTENKKIYLTKYKGTGEILTVYGAYVIDGVTYSTILNSTNTGRSPFGDYEEVTTYGDGELKSIIIKNGVTTTKCDGLFEKCHSVQSIDLSGLDTSKATSMYRMFNSCTSLTSVNLSTLNTSNVTNMQQMFYNCDNLTTLDLSSFDTSIVTNMRSMFNECNKLTTLNLSSFNTSNVIDMCGMFAYCNSLTTLNLSSFDTSNVTDMAYMFASCSGLTSIDLSNFDTSSAIKMKCMFYFCTNLTTIYVSQDKWVTSQAKTDDMFLNCGTSSVTYK